MLAQHALAAAALGAGALWAVRQRWRARTVAKSRPVVALDIDEVLGGFLPALLKFYNKKHDTSYKLDDFFSYKFCEVWGGTNEETLDEIFEFFKTDYFRKDLKPLPHASETLAEMKSKFKFVVVTSRQHEIEDETRAWLERHFGSIISRAEFGNHYSRDAPDPDDAHEHDSKRSKPEMCRDVSAVLLVDDNLDYCTKVSQQLGIPCILFGNYAWNQPKDGKLPSGVTRLNDWKAQRNSALRACLRVQGEDVEPRSARAEAEGAANQALNKELRRQSVRPRKIRRAVGKAWNESESFGVESQSSARAHLFMLDASRNSLMRLAKLLDMVTDRARSENEKLDLTSEQHARLDEKIHRVRNLQNKLSTLVDGTRGLAASYDQCLEAFAQFLTTVKAVVRPEQLARALSVVRQPGFPAAALDKLWQSTLDSLGMAIQDADTVREISAQVAPFAPSEGEHLLMESRAHIMQTFRRLILDGSRLLTAFAPEVDLLFDSPDGQRQFCGVDHVHNFLVGLRGGRDASASDPQLVGDFGSLSVNFGGVHGIISCSFVPGNRYICHVGVRLNAALADAVSTDSQSMHRPWRNDESARPAHGQSNSSRLQSARSANPRASTSDKPRESQGLPDDGVDAENEATSGGPHSSSKPSFWGDAEAAATADSVQHATSAGAHHGAHEINMPGQASEAARKSEGALLQERRDVMLNIEKMFRADPDFVQHLDQDLLVLNESLGQEFKGVDSFMAYLIHDMNRKLDSLTLTNVVVANNARFTTTFVASAIFSNKALGPSHFEEDDEAEADAAKATRVFNGRIEAVFRESTAQITQLFVLISPTSSPAPHLVSDM
ncbi:Hypothetical Protein FCC1311_048712 [Hondaea fermentalgiana]|uniref:Uncharacterized protein n=1 Tax=Hondaea fermentalgiana TaxID=2315210 RepID=A0A2R5GCF6_9STRA|nr:Hypothetical Protein FCC1311_048712 [Hondaea fermentalgiana]|eukprot:GBG28650.1 Hypothetical Protein FCC1311_048712 [Hondaea fermentalgiana]